MSYPEYLTPEEKLADGKARLGINDVVVLCGSMRFAEQMTEAALSPTLAALRDLIAADPGAMTSAEALASARTLLAAHARELGARVQERIEQDRADNPGGGQMAARNHTRRGGMMTARWVLDRYADDLDQQAAGGGA